MTARWRRGHAWKTPKPAKVKAQLDAMGRFYGVPVDSRGSGASAKPKPNDMAWSPINEIHEVGAPEVRQPQGDRRKRSRP